MKIKIDHSKDWIDMQALGFGVAFYALFNRAFPSPLGFVWGVTNGKNCFDVWGSYTLPWARRQGVRSALNAGLLRAYGRVITTEGSKTGGLAFMKARGYKFEPNTNKWFLAKPQPKAKRGHK